MSKLDGLIAAREIVRGAIRNGCPDLIPARLDLAIAAERQSGEGVSEDDWWLNHFARRDTHLTTLTTKECIDRVKAKREHLGRVVREAWVTWASHYPSSKPSWLVPYDELSESDKEADRRIGESVFRDTLTALRARPNEGTFAEGIEAAAVKAEENKLYWAAKVDPLSDLPSREIFRAKSAACFQVEMDIHSLTVPEKKGLGDE